MKLAAALASIVGFLTVIALAIYAGPALALTAQNAFESANVLSVASVSPNTPIVADVLVNGRPGVFQSYQCTTTAATAAAGVFVVDEADADTTDGFGPYCSSLAECPLTATWSGDSGRVWLRAASGTAVVTCRMGHK